MEEEGKRQSAQAIQQSPSGAEGTSAMVPGAQMNSAEKYKKSTNMAYYMFLCRAAIENNDMWDVDELFVLYTASRCERYFLVILHLKKPKNKTKKMPAVIITFDFLNKNAQFMSIKEQKEDHNHLKELRWP